MAKKCPKCQEVKDESEFHKNKGKKDGLRTHCKICVREYHQVNKELLIERAQEWRKANPERSNEATRRYYKKNIGKRAELSRLQRQRNPEINRQSQRKYRATYPERYRESARRWHQSNPEKAYEKRRRYRARELNSEGTYTFEEWQALCDYYGNKCLACRGQDPLTADHVIPLSKGGSNDIGNIQPLCKSCNSRKGNKTIDYR